MPNDIDQSRLNDAARGATVFDLDAYRNRAQSTFDGGTPVAIGMTRAMLPFWLIVAGIVILFLVFRGAR